MKAQILFSVLTLFLLCMFPRVRGGNPCRNPKGLDGASQTEGCLQTTCKNGVWRPSINTQICCYNGKAFQINSTVSTHISDDGCVRTSMECKDDGIKAKIAHSSENLCEACSTSTEVEKLNEMFGKYISEKGLSTDSLSKANTSTVAKTLTNNNRERPTPTPRLAGEMTLEHLCDAAATGDDKAVKEIIAHGAVDVNGAWNPDEDDYEWGNFHDEWHVHNGTPLHYAVKFNHPNIVSILLASKRTKLNMLDWNGWTPLHWASHMDNVECVKLLLSDTRCNHYIINTKSKEGETALMLAAKSGSLSSVWEISHLAGTDFGAECSDEKALLELAREGRDIEDAITDGENKHKSAIAEIEEKYRKIIAKLNAKHELEIEKMKQERKSKSQELKSLLNIR